MRITFLFLAILTLGSSIAFAQRSNFNRAKSSYTKYSDLKSLGSTTLTINDLQIAQEAIDKTIAHEKTKDLPETWAYYALIYSDLALIDTTEKADELYKKSLLGREKTISLDTEKAFAAELEKLNSTLAQYELGKGAKLWETNDFMGAYDSFNKGLQYLPGDTTLTYYAGIAAINAEQYDKAVQKYVDLLPAQSFSNHRQISLDVSRLFIQMKDTTNALKYAAIAAEHYPNDSEIVTHNIELNLIVGNEEKIFSTLQQQTTADPNNKTLWYYLAIAQVALNQNDEAIASYKKALAIDPNYAEANTNIGAAILQKGIQLYNETNNKNLSNAEYEKEIKKAHDIFDEAFPYLDKSVQLDDKSIIALTNLKQYHVIKENQDKADELQAKIDSLR